MRISSHLFVFKTFEVRRVTINFEAPLNVVPCNLTISTIIIGSFLYNWTRISTSSIETSITNFDFWLVFLKVFCEWLSLNFLLSAIKSKFSVKILIWKISWYLSSYEKILKALVRLGIGYCIRMLPLTVENLTLKFNINCKSLWSCCIRWTFWVTLQVYFWQVQQGNGFTSLSASHMVLILVKNSETLLFPWFNSVNCCSKEYTWAIDVYPNQSKFPKQP